MARKDGGYYVIHTSDLNQFYGMGSASAGWAVVLVKGGTPTTSNMRIIEVFRRKKPAKERAIEVTQNTGRLMAVGFPRGDFEPNLLWADVETLVERLEAGEL